MEEIAHVFELRRSGKSPCAHVLGLFAARLTRIEERIRRLQTFRDQLAAEMRKWTGNVPTICEGFCQIISSADVSAPLEGLEA